MTKSYDTETLQEYFYTFGEVCERHYLGKDFVVSCVDYGIAEVSGGRRKQDWRFPLAAIPRLEKAYRLQRDFDLDFAGLAMVLELLDEVNELRVVNDMLNRRLACWENNE